MPTLSFDPKSTVLLQIHLQNSNMGQEPTARDGCDFASSLSFSEDAMSGAKTVAHSCATEMVFLRTGRVRSTEKVMKAVAQ